ncbi:MAG: ABC transporter permease subunit [Pseudonocardiaceae bacterium]|nr:ABC transporter permease subunit [Pseudonocardiaceae bacterium]
MTIAEKLYPPSVAPNPKKPSGRRRVRSRKRIGLAAWQLGTALLIAAVWTLVYESGLLSRELVPPLWDVAREFVTLAGTAAFWAALATTVSNALTGLAAGIVVGVPFGLLLGISQAAYRSAQFLIELGRSFPVIALLPVMVLVLGATSQMEIVVVFSGVLWPILVQTIYGARRIDPVIADTVRGYRIPPLLRFVKVVLPNAAPFAATGVRIAASASILIAIGVEVLSLTPGMGGNLARAQTDGAPALALAYVVYAGLVGLAMNKILWTVEGRALAWNRRATRSEP